MLGTARTNQRSYASHFLPLRNALGVSAGTAVAAIGFMLWSTPASAYLDPGEGSMLAQAMFAATVGGFVGLRHYWRRIAGFLRSKKIRD
jgi:hypothetical protein